MAQRQPSRSGSKGGKDGRTKSRIKRSTAKRGKYKPRSAPANPKTPGERIRTARGALGLTQRELGERLRTDQTTVSAWELDKPHKLAGPSLVALARLLQTTPEAILTGKGWKPPVPGWEGDRKDHVAEPYAKDLIHLPAPPREGQVVWIPFESPNNHRAMDPRQIQTELKKALAEGRSVWVVVGD